jgi:hypothetical protein
MLNLKKFLAEMCFINKIILWRKEFI